MSLWPRTVKILISNWPRTRKFNRLLHPFDFPTIVTRWSRSTSNFMLWLVKIWQVSLCGKFMQHLEKCSLIAEADRVFCHLCDVFNCLFLLDIQNEIQLLSRSFCNLWLVCLLRFWLKNAPLVKVIGNPISYGIIFKLSLLTCPCSRRKGVE